MEKLAPLSSHQQDLAKSSFNPTSTSKSLSRKVSSCKYLKPKGKKKSIIPKSILAKALEEEEIKPISLSPSKNMKQRNPSQDRFKTTINSPINFNPLKKSKKIKEPKTDKNKSAKKFAFETEQSRKEDKLDDKKVQSKERTQPRRFSIQGFKPADIMKLGKSNTIDFKVTKIDLKANCEELFKDSVSGKSTKRNQDLNKSTKIDKKSIIRTDGLQEKQKKAAAEKQSRRVQDEMREKVTADALEKLRKLNGSKKSKVKVKSGKERNVNLKCIKKKKKKIEEVRNRVDTSPKFIKNSEIVKRIRENRAALIIQRWYRSLLIRNYSEDYESEEDSFHSGGLGTEREEWVNFLDSKYCGTNSAFVEEFKASILKSKVQVKKPQGDNESTAKSHKTSSNSESFESTLIIDPTESKSNPHPDKKLNIPKLSLSMLKNSEYSSDDDDPSQYQEDLQMSKPQNPGHSLNSESDSYSSVQLVNSKPVPQQLQAKKVPIMKSLDLGKVKTYSESSEEYSQAQNYQNDESDYDEDSGESREIQEKSQNGRKLDKDFEDSDYDSSSSAEWSQENKAYCGFDHKGNPIIGSLNANKNKNYLGYEEVEYNETGLEKEKQVKGLIMAKGEVGPGPAGIKKSQAGQSEGRALAAGEERKAEDARLKGNQKLIDDELQGIGKSAGLSLGLNGNKKMLDEGGKKTCFDSEFKISKEQVVSGIGKNTKSLIESSLPDLTSFQNFKNHKEINFEKRSESVKEGKDSMKAEKKDLNEKISIDFQNKIENSESKTESENKAGFNVNSQQKDAKFSVASKDLKNLLNFKPPPDPKLPKEQPANPEIPLKLPESSKILINSIESNTPSGLNQKSTQLNPELEKLKISITKNDPKGPHPGQNPIQQNPKPSQSIPKDPQNSIKSSSPNTNPSQSNKKENEVKVHQLEPAPANPNPTSIQQDAKPIPKESQKSVPKANTTQPKLKETEPNPAPFTSKPLFSSIDTTKPSKVVASYKPAAENNSAANDKKNESSPYDILQTSIVYPSDFQSPSISNRSDSSEKSSKPALSRRSDSHSPQQSPRLSDPISSFASKQVTKTEGKPSQNKNLFNSKLYENNSEPLSERAKNFLYSSHVVSKALELNAEKPHEENTEKPQIETQKPVSLLAAYQKQDIPDKELKVVKSPRQEPRSDLFKSFNPDASSSDDLSPRMMSRVSDSIKSEEIPDILQKLINSEIYSFLRLIPFKDTEREVDSSIEFMVDYLEVMSKELKQNEEEVLDAINTPAYQEPLHKLAVIQDFTSILSKFPTLELILPPDLCSELKVYFHSLELPSRQIYLQMLFDCVNEALNYIRPFGVDGIPDPWSSKPRILFGEAELSNVFTRIISYMIKWASCKAGIFHCYETRRDEERLLYLREEKMSSLLCLDVRDEEDNWLRYEEEEAQIKIMTSNAILQLLLDEIISIIN